MSIKSPASPALLKIAGKAFDNIDGLILDLGCGLGRNSIALAATGSHVIAADYELCRLKYLADINRHNSSDVYGADFGSINCIQSDLMADVWPFKEGGFAGVACVHFPNFAVVKNIHVYVRTGGIFYFESVAAHGKNYLQLPRQGMMRDMLSKNFEFSYYLEKHAGPNDQKAVTVRFLATRT